MPRYRFMIRWFGGQMDDEAGEWLPDDAAAREHGEMIIRDVKEGGGYDDPDYTMIVIDDAGQEVSTIRFPCVAPIGNLVSRGFSQENPS
jgi:hypothetical protein